MTATYEPRKDTHPVLPALQLLGDLTLVGSRALQACPAIATPESDWDYYLTPTADAAAAPSPAVWMRAETARLEEMAAALRSLGFALLAGEGGPYGADQMIEGIWRLEAHRAYGRDWPGVDVILARREVTAVRLPVLERIAQSGRQGGLLCRGLKAEKAWGIHWWAHGGGR